MSEFGLIAPVGRNGFKTLMEIVADREDARVPDDARGCLAMLADQLDLINEQILESDRRILANARSTDVGRRLMESPGVGPVLGHDWGGSIAWMHAFMHLEKLDNRIILSTPHPILFMREMQTNPTQQASSQYLRNF